MLDRNTVKCFNVSLFVALHTKFGRILYFVAYMLTGCDDRFLDESSSQLNVSCNIYATKSHNMKTLQNQWLSTQNTSQTILPAEISAVCEVLCKFISL